MKTFILNRIAIVAIMVCAVNSLLAQTGTLKGKVIDRNTSETIIGGNVTIQGTTHRTATDENGLFEFKYLAAGTYQLIVSYLGYQPKTVEVNVDGSNEQTVQIALLSESTHMNAVVITGRVNKQSESALLAERKNSNIIVQKIGAQELDRKGLGNVGEGLTKVSGVSVVGEKALFVRGLGDRYNNATLNGLPIPSTNPDVKVIPLDIFPTSLVENIAVVKSYTSQFYGDFSGGTIDIVTKTYPNAPFFKVAVSTGYNSITTGKKFLQSPNANRGFFGFDKNRRALPATVAQTTIYNSYENGNNSDPFRVNWSPQASIAPVNRGVSLSAGNSYSLNNGHKLGFIVNLAHKGGYSLEEGISALYNAQQAPRYRYETESFGFKTNTSGLLSMTYGPGPRSHYTFTALAVNQSNDVVFDNYGEQSDLGILYGRRNTLIQNSLLSGQLASTLDFTERRKLKWAVGFTKTIGSTPDRTQNTFRVNNGQYTFLRNSDSDNHRFFAKLDDNEASGKVEMEVKTNESAALKSFQFGVDGRYKFRRFDARQFDAKISISDPVDPENVGDVLSDSNLGNGSTMGEWYYQEGYYAPNNYRADLAIAAPYINLSFDWNEKWKLIAGLRVEASIQNTDYKRGSDAFDLPFRRNTLQNLDFLPGATLKYLLNEKSNVLLAASRTISRPLFTEVAPFRYNNASATAEKQGNPNLMNTSNLNVDLKYEIYPSRGELMAISLFGKYLKDPIEMMQVATSDAMFSYINTDRAVVAGVEVELNRNLGALFHSENNAIKNMSVGFNGSYMYNQIRISDETIIRNREQGVPVAPTNRTRPLYGASPYLINFDYSYRADWSKNSNSIITVAYNVFGKRLFIAGSEQAGDIYELPVNSLDATINTMLNKNIGFDLSFLNLLNPAVVFEQEFSDNNLEFSRFKKGVSISASLSYKF